MGKASAETTGGKSWQTNTQSGQQGLDAQTQKWKDEIFGAAQGAGGQIPDSVRNAMGFFNGDPGAQQRFMNPYQQQVVDQVQKQYAEGDKMVRMNAGDEAQMAGAFGGSRHGVAEGVASAQNTQNRDAQIAGLMSQGFEGAAGRAGMAANLGMQAGSPELWRLMQLKNGFQGMPHGMTYSGTSGQTNTDMKYGFKGKLGIFGG